MPDRAGRTIFFTTDGPTGPAILRVPAAGGAVRTVLAGAPLVDPAGLVVSADGRRLFVADPGAGRILVVRASCAATVGSVGRPARSATASGAPALVHGASLDQAVSRGPRRRPTARQA